MHHILNFIFIVFSILGCKQNEFNQNKSIIMQSMDTVFIDSKKMENLVGSTWICMPFGDNCIDYLKFINISTFSLDTTCEVLDSTFGKWKIINDTLILEEIGSYYTYDLNDENFEEIDKMKWKAALINNTIILKYAYRWDPNHSKFYDKPNVLDEKFNVFIRIQ